MSESSEFSSSRGDKEMSNFISYGTLGGLLVDVTNRTLRLTRGPVKPVKDGRPHATRDLLVGYFVPVFPCMRVPRSKIEAYDPVLHKYYW